MAGPPPFSWTSGSIHLDVIVGVGLLGGAYLGAWATLWVRTGGRDRPGNPPGRPSTERSRALLFFGGLLALVAALNGPLHDLSDYYLFSAHMVQHLVLTLVVPPLLLAVTPAWMADSLLRRLSRWRPLGALMVSSEGACAAYYNFGRKSFEKVEIGSLFHTPLLLLPLPMFLAGDRTIHFACLYDPLQKG